MTVLVAFPSTAIFGQQAALAFHERGQLAAFETAFVYWDDSVAAHVVRSLPPGLRSRIEPQLKRRALSVLPRHAVNTSPAWEIVRTLATMATLSPPTIDRIWDHMSHAFTSAVARKIGPPVSAVYAFEYTALEAFRAAKEQGVRCILDFPSLNSREFELQQRAEKDRFPELRGPHDAYFEARFAQRQARRDAEMHLADIIITNSSVTRASHIAGGAPAHRTISVPYGAPPPLARAPDRSGQGPLRIVWAGTFSIRKGAHYLIEAWRKLAAGRHAVLEVYGAVTMPERAWTPTPPGVTFHGSVVQAKLFEAFDRADALIFPTLSDGFGMVVTEAFARGLPVITTDRAGASDLVRTGENGLIIRAGDTEAILAALRWCLDDRARLAAMSPAALETARGWQWSDYRRALIAATTTGIPGADTADRVIPAPPSP